MIDAQRARELAGIATVGPAVDRILKAIEETAKDGNTILKTGWDYKEDRYIYMG